MGVRDLLRMEPNERLDLPDFEQLQRGARAEARAIARAVLFGGADTKKVLGGWVVTANSPADALVNVARGAALGAYEEPLTGAFDYGASIYEGESTQELDFSALANGTYGIWIRLSAEASTQGNRVFWDGTNDTEVIDALDTRYVVAWDTQISASSPGTGWMQVASVAWAGSTVASGDITHNPDMFFEGNAAASYAHVWGDGGNDRNTNRALYGVGSLYTFVHAMRRQIEEIVGDGQKWYEDFDHLAATQFMIEATANTWDAAALAMSTGDVIFTIPAGYDFQVNATSSTADVRITAYDTILAAPAGGTFQLDTSSPGAVTTFTMDDFVLTAADGTWDATLSTFDLTVSAGDWALALSSLAVTGAVPTAPDWGYATTQWKQVEIPLALLYGPADFAGTWFFGSGVGLVDDDPGNSFQAITINGHTPPDTIYVPLEGFVLEAVLRRVQILCRSGASSALTVAVTLEGVTATGSGTTWSTIVTDSQDTVATHTDRQWLTFDFTGTNPLLDLSTMYRLKIDFSVQEMRANRIILEYGLTTLKAATLITT